MKTALDIFKQIASIPHISFHTQELFEWIVKFCKNCGYEVHTDSAKNIHAFGKIPSFVFNLTMIWWA